MRGEIREQADDTRRDDGGLQTRNGLPAVPMKLGA
jgi:hypothetical protein